MVAIEINAQNFLFRQPAIKMVKAASMDITTTSTGNCSTASISFHLPPAILSYFVLAHH